VNTGELPLHMGVGVEDGYSILLCLFVSVARTISTTNSAPFTLLMVIQKKDLIEACPLAHSDKRTSNLL